VTILQEISQYAQVVSSFEKAVKHLFAQCEAGAQVERQPAAFPRMKL
jgi:hypothetical protein